MPKSRPKSAAPSDPFDVVKRLFRPLGSLRLAVIVLSALAAVMAYATFVEGAKGRDYALWHFYQSPWFMGLIGLLALNILVSMLLRFPWGWRHTGFVITHVGLLMLLIGAVQTFYWGIEGTLRIEEGQSSGSIALPDRNRFEVHWRRGRDSANKIAFFFRPGPDAWPETKSLDLGVEGGVSLRVLRYLRNAQVDRRWIGDTTGQAVPALEWSILDGNGRTRKTEWLVAEGVGGSADLGVVSIEFQSAPAATMLDDLLKPPPAETDKEGVLSVHYEGGVQRLPVSASRGKKTPLGDGKTTVEIAEYLPNGPAGSTDADSEGHSSLRPVVNVLVHTAGKDSPERLSAAAGAPFVRSSARDRASPVKLWYHHPALKAPPKIQFVQFPDGKLYGRVGQDGKWGTPALVAPGFQAELAMGFKMRVEKHLPRATEKIEFAPAAVDASDPEARRFDPAALVEISAGGAKQQAWLMRGGEFSHRDFSTPDGDLSVDFGYDREPLGFDVRLVRFDRTKNPGGMGDAGFASTVRVATRGEKPKEHVISMNRPLKHGKFVFYQSGFDSQGRRPATVLSVSYDPGRRLKYLGSLVLCVGMVIVMLQQGRKMSRRAEQQTQAEAAKADRASGASGNAETD